jgi:hypothetical protein
MRTPILVAVIMAITGPAWADLNRDQRLIVACHRVDTDGVVAALREGANVNARFGDGDRNVLQDPWDLGRPVAAKNWTPLIAVASSSLYPDPPRKIENTVADLDWSRAQRAKIAPERLKQREGDAVTIALILLSHKADVDAHDGRPFTRPSTRSGWN